MFSTVGDIVSVAGVFCGGKFHPKKFLWRGHTYNVDEVTMRTQVVHDGVRMWMYSIRSAQNIYRFLFHSDASKWILEEVWCEG